MILGKINIKSIKSGLRGGFLKRTKLSWNKHWTIMVWEVKNLNFWWPSQRFRRFSVFQKGGQKWYQTGGQKSYKSMNNWPLGAPKSICFLLWSILEWGPKNMNFWNLSSGQTNLKNRSKKQPGGDFVVNGGLFSVAWVPEAASFRVRTLRRRN